MSKTFATTCSGIGAPEVAFGRLGWQSLFCSEIEKFPCAVLRHHYAHVPNLGDLTKYHEWPEATPDVLCAGTPCQAFSVAGLRKGLADPRGNLTLTFLGLVARYTPRWLLWENVPGVLSDKSGAFGSFLGGLGQLGYGFAYRVLDAQYYGVAQRRRRVFVVGHLGGQWQRAAAVLFERDCLLGHPPPRRQTGKGTAHELSQSLGESGRGFERAGESRGQDPVIAHAIRAEGFDASEDGTPLVPQVAPTLDQRSGRSGENSFATSGGLVPSVVAHGQGNAEHVKDGSPSLTCNHEAPILFEPIGFPSELSGTQRCAAKNLSPSMSQAAPAVALQEIGKRTGRSTHDKQHGSGISAPGDPMFTLQSGAVHGIAAQMSVRRLTPRECERLQGFPDDYTLIDYRGKPACDGPRYKALGNSMAVPVIEWIARRMDLVDELVPLK